MLILDIYATHRVFFLCCCFLRPLIGDLQEYQSWFACFVIVVLVVVDDDNTDDNSVCVCMCVSEKTHMLHVCDALDKHSDSSKHVVFYTRLKHVNWSESSTIK